jgi:hypothetical protein
MCLLKIDTGAPIAMQHLRSTWEVAITDTDAAMGMSHSSTSL